MAEATDQITANMKEDIFNSTMTNSFFQSSDTSCVSNDTLLTSNLLMEMESDASETLKTPKSKGGRITCCIPLCYNNSQRNPSLSFYVIPKDPVLRKKWLIQISRKDFVPSKSHRVCSDHFVGGKKTYMNNIPTIVPKTIKPKEWKPRKTMSSSGMDRNLLSPIRTSNVTKTIENQLSLEEELKMEIDQLTKELQDLRVKFEQREDQLKTRIQNLEATVQNNKFAVDRFKHNEAHFKFYTGFESYDIFKIVLDYLQPAASKLVYWGSNTNMESKKTEDVNKRGRSRMLTAEEEFFMVLVRLRCAFPLEDLTIRYNMSTSHISRIIITSN